MAECACTVRKATSFDVPLLREIAQAAQDKLTRSGSAQRIAGYARRNMTRRAERGELYVLEASAGILGGAFMEPVTPERFPQIGGWNVAPEGCPVRFLYGLVIAPAWQGRGLGRVLLGGLRLQEPSATLALDCWAGNHRLRRFYLEAGFQLRGEFPEDDYRVAVFTWTSPATGDARLTARTRR